MTRALFDRNALEIQPLKERDHDLDLSVCRPLAECSAERIPAPLEAVADRIIQARHRGSAVILMMGAHVLRSGVQRYLIDLMEKGYLSCLAMNGAGIIHDYEFARIGATTESVARYIQTGEFGMWKETGFLNDIINHAYFEDPQIGLGEAVGRAILKEDLPHREISLFAAAVRLGIPATVHVGMGYDIIHQHPNCDGAATGALTYNDFLKFAAGVSRLENGVILNFGSSVMAPEVFLKALSMARNVKRQKGETLRRFTTLVCDLLDLPQDFRREPSRDDPAYYFRPWKTMLVRTVADGGESFYVKGTHAETLPALWTAISRRDKNFHEDRKNIPFSEEIG